MKQIQIKDEPASIPVVCCDWCDRVTRLIGSEPHPVHDHINLLTFLCTACDEFTVLPEESPARIH